MGIFYIYGILLLSYGTHLTFSLVRFFMPHPLIVIASRRLAIALVCWFKSRLNICHNFNGSFAHLTLYRTYDGSHHCHCSQHCHGSLHLIKLLSLSFPSEEIHSWCSPYGKKHGQCCTISAGAISTTPVVPYLGLL